MIRTSRSLAALLTALLALACFGGAWAATRPPSLATPRTAIFIPNDSADGAGRSAAQWNFAGAYGVDAPVAWANLIAAGAPGGSGVTVAVLDTGVSHGARPPAQDSPELAAAQLAPGWDFVDNDPDPSDENGHGTQVASTIIGLTGLAYGARIMPIRVFDSRGTGDTDTIARGVRFAVDHGAKVINLSFAFDVRVTEADIAPLLTSLEYAAQRGALVVGASGNEGSGSVNLPARSRHVLSVGATTEFGCVSDYSNHGRDLDLVAPGGGTDAGIQDAHCKAGRQGRAIPQLDRFGIASGGVGTSMAVAHVSATAALVVASGVVGRNPTPAKIERRLERTARDLGAPGYDERYGWGLVSAGAATASTARPVVVRYSHGRRPS